VRNRLKLSEAELTQIVGKAGNSSSAISKQAALRLGKETTRQATSDSLLGYLERFRAKWTPVRVKKTRKNKNLELRF
jgi:hypothetical protein